MVRLSWHSAARQLTSAGATRPICRTRSCDTSTRLGTFILSRRVGRVSIRGRASSSVCYPRVEAQINYDMLHSKLQGCIYEAVDYRTKSSRVAPSQVSRSEHSASFAGRVVPVRAPTFQPAARLGPSVPFTTMDDGDEAKRDPTNSASSRIAYDPYCVTRARRKRASEYQTFDMLLKINTKKCA